MKTSLSIFILFNAIFLYGSSFQNKELNIEITGTSQAVISLNGTWKFSMNPPEKHWENSVDFSEWSDILVPGECQMQGFAIKHDMPYVYKMKFDVPSDFKGKQVYLDFHGVYSYARVWVNGKFVREHHGGFTRWSCPITDKLEAGQSAILTVEIVDRADDISYGSGYAKHQIGGILRDVELSALPEQHFKHYYIETDLDEEFEDAELKISYSLQKDGPTRVKVELMDHLGEKVLGSEQNLESSSGVIRIPVNNPNKWDAEHPYLYTLVTTLFENGIPALIQEEKIGFREVKVEGNRLLVNGSPVKLRGACRHDIHPTLGRMTTPFYDLLDVKLAKECNMNFIRTSHYPPSEAFLDYCDQYGIYVEDETAVCFVGSHRTEIYRGSGASQSDPEFTDRYLSQLEEMVHYHRNHPSVIIWSIGNENVFGDNFIKSFQWVKKQDPTRPVIYSYPGQVPDTMVNYEILSMHYPSWRGNLDQYGIITKKFSYDKMPALYDEWAHVACYNNFELREDPNVRNFWGQSLDSMWTYTFEAEGGLGGAIWCMLDETFALPPDLPGFNQWWGILDKNVIPATYKGPCVGYGEWGIVDTWRRKKPEFWGTKKAYSPARILVKKIDAFTPGEPLSIPVHNRFDHTNFSELKIKWIYADHSGRLAGIDLPPHEKGSLLIPANSWIDGENLHLEFYQHDTLLVDSYKLLLGDVKAKLPVSKAGSLELIEEPGKITLIGKEFRLHVSPGKGILEDVILGGDTLIKSGPYLNLRVPGKAIQYSTIEMDDLAKNWKCIRFSYSLDEGLAVLKTEGLYDSIKVNFNIKIDEHGTMEIAYKARMNGQDKTIQEAGIKFLTGDSYEKLNWKRDPYFTAYPDTHMGRAEGEAILAFRPESYYRIEPGHGWAHDSRGFYYFGLEEKLPYTNEVRALKEHIYEYALSTHSKARLKVFSNGDQACRFDRIRGENTLLINEQWDYNSLLWGNYMKRIPLKNEFAGKVHMTLTNGAGMKAFVDSISGQIIISEDDTKVLQYNYQTVYEEDVVRPGSKQDQELVFSNMSGVYYEEYLKAHPELERNDTTTSSIYSVPRSDYIHPLYGLEGALLTSDWPDGGHPHHRGIFWAWPEVMYGDQLGDIYALQRVFARPTGNVKYTNGPEYAEIDAENLWMWEENIAIVRENAVIRVFRSTADSRIIDLSIKLLALEDSVTLATRFTNSYGGLNIRMQTPEKQEISYFTDDADSLPRRAWSDFSGIFEGNVSKSGLLVLQHQENPEYPGAWRDYPDLAWVQPTFPTPETRYLLSKNEPLVLRYRLIIHAGGKPTKEAFMESWDAYHEK